MPSLNRRGVGVGAFPFYCTVLTCCKNRTHISEARAVLSALQCRGCSTPHGTRFVNLSLGLMRPMLHGIHTWPFMIHRMCDRKSWIMKSGNHCASPTTTTLIDAEHDMIHGPWFHEMCKCFREPFVN